MDNKLSEQSIDLDGYDYVSNYSYWGLSSEVDFLYKFLKKTKSKEKSPYNKLLLYMEGLDKRVVFPTFEKKKIYRICYFLKRKLRNANVVKKVNWLELRKELKQLIKDV